MTAAAVRSLLTVLAVTAALVMAADAAAIATNQGRRIETAGVALQIPAGWHAQASTTSCDPERLIVASSRPVRIGRDGLLSSPSAGAVLIVLLEDRYRQDRPVGDLHRPQHFSVGWNHLTRIEPCCGLPDTPAYMHYFHSNGRYLGFIVYPGSPVATTTREATDTLLDSLSVAA